MKRLSPITILLCILTCFATSQATEAGRSLFNKEQREELRQLKKPEQLVENYQRAVKQGTGKQLKNFLRASSERARLALSQRWKNPEKYWARVDRQMLRFYFHKWLKREWMNLEDSEMKFFDEERGNP